MCITTSFPPYAGSGGQRVLKFIKNFNHFNWQSVVLTRQATSFETQDGSLVDEIPGDCEVHWTKSWDPAFLADRLRAKEKGEFESKERLTEGHRKGRAKSLWDVLKNWILTPHPFLLWIPFACGEAARVIRKRKIDIIFADSRIASIAACLISSKHGIPYVIDYRNSWVGDPHLHMPTSLHRSFNKWLESKVLRSASGAVFLADVSREDTLSNYPFYDPNHTFLIPNGYDKSDFQSDPCSDSDADQTFTIGYIGSIYTHYMSPFKIFCQALNRLLRECHRRDVRFRVVGRASKEVTELVDTYGLSHITSVEGYMRHSDATRALLKSDVLLLLLDQPEDNRKPSVPGKIYEYMASQKKILYIGPDCETSKLMEKYKLGVCVFVDVDVACAALRNWKQAHDQGRLPGNPQSVAVRFERRVLTECLVGAFDMVLKETKE